MDENKQTARIKTGENETASKGHVWEEKYTNMWIREVNNFQIFPSPFQMEKNISFTLNLMFSIAISAVTVKYVCIYL